MAEPRPTPVSTDSVLQAMADALPTHQPNDESSDIASSYEVVALLAHAYFVSLDFRLYGFNEDKLLEECQTLAPRLPPQWNNGFGALSFVYRHKQSAMTFVLRVDRMGAKVEVRALAVGDEKIYRIEYETRKVVNASKLPFRIPLDGQGQENRSNLVERLKALFDSPGTIERIIRDLRVNLVQKLIPRLQKEGYSETEEGVEQKTPSTIERRIQESGQQLPPGFEQPGRFDPPSSMTPSRPGAIPQASEPFRPQQPPHPYPHPDLLPNAGAPRRPIPGDFPPPGFEDEHEINAPPRNMGGLRMPPINIGHDDLNPQGLGPHDPLRGSFVGGGPPRPGGFSGMHPTFGDPLFTGQGGYGGQQYGQGYNSQRPPGARYDPVDPSDGPMYPLGQQPPFPGRGGGRGGNNGGFGFGPGGFGSGSGGFGPGDII
ncbi:PI31 proteasome regulator N-terminal domain-containing protein [Trichoderma camerunense]